MSFADEMKKKQKLVLEEEEKKASIHKKTKEEVFEDLFQGLYWQFKRAIMKNVESTKEEGMIKGSFDIPQRGEISIKNNYGDGVLQEKTELYSIVVNNDISPSNYLAYYFADVDFDAGFFSDKCRITLTVAGKKIIEAFKRQAAEDEITIRFSPVVEWWMNYGFGGNKAFRGYKELQLQGFNEWYKTKGITAAYGPLKCAIRVYYEI